VGARQGSQQRPAAAAPPARAMGAVLLALLILLSADTAFTGAIADGGGDGKHPCYWYAGYDARGVNNTGWSGRGANNCTAGPQSARPCTKEDCCEQCQSTDPSFRNPQTGERCAFAVWNPSASACFFKTAGAVLFAKPGDIVCCPPGAMACPSSPPQGGGQPWRLRRDLSDEFVAESASKVAPINLTKWNTSVKSWGDWTWDPQNVRTVAQLPSYDSAIGSSFSSELPNASGYAALTMSYEPHQRTGPGGALEDKTYYYKGAIMKSTVPAGITYGRFEARIRGADRFPGVCPAFWAWRHDAAAAGGAYWTELDFVEMQENLNSAKDIDFTSHVFPPTPGVTCATRHYRCKPWA
jgi:hypothetical protein